MPTVTHSYAHIFMLITQKSGVVGAPSGKKSFTRPTTEFVCLSAPFGER